MKGEIIQQKLTDDAEYDRKIKVISSDIKILYLTLTKKWFDQIVAGEKKLEYRQVKEYWVSRLFNRDGTQVHYDYIFFRNGYAKDSPSIVVEYLGIVGISDFESDECFELGLGDICEDVAIEKEMLSEEEKVDDKREKIMGFR